MPTFIESFSKYLRPILQIVTSPQPTMKQEGDACPRLRFTKATVLVDPF